MARKIARPTLPSELSGILTDEEIEHLSNIGVITPFDRNMLSGCSYDLRVGKLIRSRNRQIEFNIERLPNEEYHLESGECVTFTTLEVLDFSNPLLFGFVVNKHSILAKGLVHPITKIDPGFKGPLAITIFNHGSVPEPIRLNHPLVSMIIMKPNSIPQRIYGSSQMPSYRQGTTEIASIYNDRLEPLDDAGLAKMYGRPVARLYTLIEDLQKSVDLGLVKQEKASKAAKLDLIGKILIALLSAILTLGGKFIIDNWTTWFSQ